MDRKTFATQIGVREILVSLLRALFFFLLYTICVARFPLGFNGFSNGDHEMHQLQSRAQLIGFHSGLVTRAI